MATEGRAVLTSPLKLIIRLPAKSKQANLAGSPATALPVPPKLKQVQVTNVDQKAVPLPKKLKQERNHLDEKKAVEKLRMRYQQEAARKQSRKIQILAEAEAPLPPPPSSRSSSNKRKIFPSSASSSATAIKKQQGSSIMKKARKEYLNSLEVRNLASMAAQKRMQPRTIASRF